MKIISARYLSRFPALALLVASAGCTAATSGEEPRGHASLADTPAQGVTPLWSTSYPSANDTSPGTPAWASFVAGEVQDSGNTVVTGHSQCNVPHSGCEIQTNLFIFNPDGSFGRKIDLDEGEPVGPRTVRANDAGIVAGVNGHGAEVFRFDAAGQQQIFRYVPVSPSIANRGLTGLDICDDGTTVASFDVPLTAGGASQLLLQELDASGNLQWSSPLPAGFQVDRLRCLGTGQIDVVGISNGSAAALQYEPDGSTAWQWTASGSAAAPVPFDIDNNGNLILAANGSGSQTVYALDPSGNPLWSAAAPSAVSGLAASDVVYVTGQSTAAFDGNGNPIFTSTVSGASAAIDDNDDVFVCSNAQAALVGPDGSTLWTYPLSWAGSAIRADVTNGVARCIGGGISLVAFQVP